MAKGWPNKERGRTCFLGWKPKQVEDFNRNKHWVYSELDLQRLYKLSEDQRIEKSRKLLGEYGNNNMEPDSYCDWLVRRGICPHAIVTANSRYHFENSVLMDSEMGLKLPDPQVSLSETPAIFFQAVSVVRSERAKVKEEDGKGNRN
jgi:hypothetical protein